MNNQEIEKKVKKEKKAETTANIWDKASALGKKTLDAGKRAADGIQKGAAALSEKAKQDAIRRKVKKLSPLFPNDFKSENFKIPNIIKIVDDAVRREIEICNGAIGWLENGSDVEVLCLYDEWVSQSGIQFVPNASCDEMYCVDKFDRKKFIRADYVFGKAHEEKLAELEHIAHSLGAKSCSIEITESNASTETYAAKKSAQTGIKQLSLKSSASKSTQNGLASRTSGKAIANFSGNDNPTPPTLKWFANDDSIKRLIDMRCSEKNSIRSRTLILEGSSSATMSQNAAYAIDCALENTKGGNHTSMSSQASREYNSQLIFEIEF